MPCLIRPDDWDSAGWAVFDVSVDAGPRSVTAVWWPTLNDPDCRVVSSRGDAAVAGILAGDVRTAPPLLSGVRGCPMAVGGAVDLYFAYPGGRWERVRVYPTGCGTVAARHRRPRRAVFAADLAGIAPPGEWQHRLG